MTADERVRPAWFDGFLANRGTRKPSAHTLAAYRRDFDAIAETIVGGDDLTALRLDDINKDALQTAFAVFADTHAAASIRRCWSTWNTLCTYLYSEELIAANPMAKIGQPKTDATLAKALPPNAIDALLDSLNPDQGPKRRDDWVERDRAMVLTCLLAGLRLEELVGVNFGDIRAVGDGAVIHVRGKGRKDRRIPIEGPLIGALEVYLTSRRTRFPDTRRGSSPAGGLGSWPADAPLFVSAKDGTRITRHTVQYRVLRLFRRAGINSERQRGALVHGLRHTFATDLANANVSVYELKALLGHESIATTQRYVDGAGQETRAAAARNPLYERLRGDTETDPADSPTPLPRPSTTPPPHSGK